MSGAEWPEPRADGGASAHECQFRGEVRARTKPRPPRSVGGGATRGAIALEITCGAVNGEGAERRCREREDALLLPTMINLRRVGRTSCRPSCTTWRGWSSPSLSLGRRQ